MRIRVSFIALLFLMLVVLFILISINVFGITFRKLGFPPQYSVYFLFLSLLCSYVNIPIKKIIPVEIKRSTSITVNLGGAVIPIVMSVFLITIVSPVEASIGILVMTIIIHKMARPVKGSGIAIHALIPPILAAFVALIISPRDAPIIAYISGTLGCLIGIDILNIRKIPDLSMKMISIGGAGTFDAIFLTGIISVLLA